MRIDEYHSKGCRPDKFAQLNVSANERYHRLTKESWRLCRARHRRHTFAVNTLLKIKQRGASAQKALPVLADYLGHNEYKYTAVYLRVADAIS